MTFSIPDSVIQPWDLGFGIGRWAFAVPPLLRCPAPRLPRDLRVPPPSTGSTQADWPLRGVSSGLQPGWHVTWSRSFQGADPWAAGHGSSDRPGPSSGGRGAASWPAAGERAGVALRPGGERCAGAVRPPPAAVGGKLRGPWSGGSASARLGLPENVERRLDVRSSWKRPGRGAAGCRAAGRGTLNAWVGARGAGKEGFGPRGAPAYLLNGR